MRKLLIIFVLIGACIAAKGQSIQFNKVTLLDTVSVSKTMQNLAKDYLQLHDNLQQRIEPDDLYFIQIIAGNYVGAIETIQSTRGKITSINQHPDKLAYELFAQGTLQQQKQQIDFKTSYRSVLKGYLKKCTDTQLSSVNIPLTTYDGVVQFTNEFKEYYEKISDSGLSYKESLTLLRLYFNYKVFSSTEPIIFTEIKKEQERRYLIEQHVIISPIDSAEISVTTVRKRGTEPLPAILTFTIYADSTVYQSLVPASKGYVGVLATSRGKRWSSDSIVPYKYEHKDAYAVIDWISKQPWSNGKVGMFGGSYNGFTQWASMKDSVHPALKTIVPCVSAAPGIDVPMENNVFHNFTYKWISYVTQNRYLYNTDYQRWNKLQDTWFKSGEPYAKMDSIDGVANPLFHEWISHPDYDAYWQSMIPYKDEFAHIDIPILSITGYYDDGQPGAMYYYNQHVKYNTDAEHYLVIGPYDHWGAQGTPPANLRGYQLDEVAQIPIRDELVFDWFDHILKGKAKPELLKNKVNFQVMGTNTWQHSASVDNMYTENNTFYLSSQQSDENYTLSVTKPKKEYTKLQVDLVDRTRMNNADYYPWPLVKDSIDYDDRLVFISKPFDEEKIISGSFTGELQVICNKKDFDFSVIVYELTPEGKYFHLSYYIGRASYTKDNENRQLLVANKETTLTFSNTRIISKKLAKGSRLVIVVNGNKNPYSQINYGTGKDVSVESIEDVNEKLRIQLSSRSKINIPILE